MLRWKKGGREEDGIWAKYWYKNLHDSTGFLKYEKKKIILSTRNEKLAKDCLSYYEFLNIKSIRL